MQLDLLTPREVDLILRYPAGKSLKLAKAGKIKSVPLPDGSIRFAKSEIEKIVNAGRHEPTEATANA